MFVDIHTHILPGMDDGAPDTEAALEMLKQAANENPEGTLIATPHYIHGELTHPPGEIARSCLDLMNAAEEHGIRLRICPGSETFMCPELPDLVQGSSVATLNNSRYILVELPMMSIPIYTVEVFFKLKLAGHEPIIAHPERHGEIRKNPGILYDLITRGLYSQVNASSLNGIYGREVRDSALMMIRHNLVHFIASDAHTCKSRSTELRKAFELVSREFGDAAADRLFRANGLSVLEDLQLETPEPIKVVRSSTFKLGFKKTRVII